MTIEAETKEKPMYVRTYYSQCLEFPGWIGKS